MTTEITMPPMLPDGTVCKGVRHTPTHDSWRNGCRHGGAIEAHRQWVAARRPESMHPAAVDADGNCIAHKHGSGRAYQQAGCRHPEAIAAWEAIKRRRNDAKRRRRDVRQAKASKARADRAFRATGGRLAHDPRVPWRMGRMAVSRINLWMLVRGFVDSPTMAEKLAAVVILSKTMAGGDAWYERGHLMTPQEIADRIGSTSATIGRLRAKRVWLAEHRTERRLADTRWKEAFAAAAGERKAVARAQHAGPTRKQRRAQDWKAHCRTMRRLRESQDRAKRVALAMQR